jgi:hypothetical protein
LLQFKGMAMWWFNKAERKEVWDEDIQWPIGDIEAAHKIRDICRSAADSAEKVGSLAGRPDTGKGKDRDVKNNKFEADRYERAAKVAMEIAIQISDGLLRDSAVRQIVNLCMTARDVRTARILFRAIQSASIREEALNDYPMLRQ